MNSHIEEQICLKVVQNEKNKNNDFSFVFSLKQDHIYINSLTQDINYGWEEPQGTNINSSTYNNSNKPSSLLSFQESKTKHSISLKGVIYTQLNSQKNILASGIESLTKLKLQANKGVRWHIIGENGTHYNAGGKGEWFIEKIEQNSSHFITGLNALKVEFTINLKKYK